MTLDPHATVVAPDGAFSAGDLAAAASRVAGGLLAATGTGDLAEARVAICAPPSFAFLALLHGVWQAGGIALPLAPSHPAAELEYAVRDGDAALVAAAPEMAGRLAPLASAAHVAFALSTDLLAASSVRAARAPAPDRRALILYTSGTTARPKGVVTTHANLAAQVESLVAAWEWTRADRTLLVLPLHHVHGLINVVGCALASGATLEVSAGFEADAAWDRLASGEITVFTAVPTIYRRLIQAWDTASEPVRRRRSAGAGAARLMMSGSAALPVATLDRWREITGHTLLERYGMTEIGMALANPLHGERRPGHVGSPLPGVEAQIVGEEGAAAPDGEPGELEVRGPGVFLEYWRRPDDTRRAFREGWFRTGDVAAAEHGIYRLLGRTSIDIIKTGGYKVSALENRGSRADPSRHCRLRRRGRAGSGLGRARLRRGRAPTRGGDRSELAPAVDA